MKNIAINYKRIFNDILETKHPEKKNECLPLLQRNNLSAIDIIEINKKIFGTTKENNISNQKFRSYSKSDILKILDYQVKNNLNNIQLANHFNLSKNTVTKWKRLFLSVNLD